MSSLPSPASLRPEDHRKAVRPRVLMGAKLYIGAFNPTIIDGLATDLTEEGARFEMPAPMQVPDLFKIRIGNGEVRRARRCWTRGNMVGLEFIPS